MISATATRHLFAALKGLYDENNTVEFKTTDDWVKCDCVLLDNSNENLTLTLVYEFTKKLQIIHYARSKLLFQFTEDATAGKLNISAVRSVHLQIGDVLRLELM